MSAPRHRVEVQLDRDDLVRFNQVVMGADPRVRRLRLLVPLMAAGALALGVVRHEPAYLGVSIVLILMSLVISPAGVAYLARRHARRPPRPGERRPVTAWKLSFEDEGVVAETAAGTVELTWDEIAWVDRRPEALYLMTTRRSGYAIPRRSLTDPAAFAALGDFVEGAVQAANPPGRSRARSPYRLTLLLWAMLAALFAVVWFLSRHPLGR